MSTCVPLVGGGTGVCFAKTGGVLGFVTMRQEICSLDVACTAGPARHGICVEGLSVSLPLWRPAFWGLSPLHPLFAFVVSCVGVGFLAGCLIVFLWFFMVGAGVGLISSAGVGGQ